MDPAWVAGAGAVISSAAAIWSATNGNRTLKRSDRDSQARTRPMVAAELRSDPYATAVQILVVKNYGPTIARNVRVMFDPALEEPDPDEAARSVAHFLIRRYAKPIPTLVPGMELHNIYFDGDDGGTKNRNPFPDQVSITIEFDAPDGAHYIDCFELDVDLIRDWTFVTSSRHPEERLKEALTQLKNANQSLARMANSVARLGRSPE